MANRTSLLVISIAATLLIASFSLQSEGVRASESHDAAFAEIDAIKTAAWSAIDDRTAAAIAEIGGAVKVGEANSAKNAGLNAIESIYGAAVEDIAEVVEGAPGAEPVAAAGQAAVDALAAQAAQATAEITAAHDAWLDANWEWTAEDIIADIEWWVEHGIKRLDDIVDDYASDLGESPDSDAAAALRDEALADAALSIQLTIEKLDGELARLPDDPAVQAAHTQALTDVEAARGEAELTLNALFDEFVENQPPATTTTTSTVPPVTTTSTIPPATTTTTRPPASTTTTSTTTTTLAPATSTTTTTTVAPTTTTTTTLATALLPSVDPPMAEALFMTDMPAPIVLSASPASASNLPDDSQMATVGLVRRVVDSQLPAGVSTVAAGPLVVLGLVIDAIRAAGALMAVPWLLLGFYMAGLLRHQRSALTA